ncbi:MAG: radical SAM protein [Bacteroidales bacterium]|nr:radical SAM protein [Bacteroidales bacterium]
MLHFDDIVFGPIFSRRLGSSLGVNLLPSKGKLCNFDCVYCECGWNKDGIAERIFPRLDDVEAAMEQKMSKAAEEGVPVDSITFSGNGEPTMNPDFPEIIDVTLRLRDRYFPKAKVSVLSNATLIGRKAVAQALMKVDNPILKIDASEDTLVKRINKPVGSYQLADVIENLRQFEGKFILQTMFLKSPDFDTAAPEPLEAWRNIVRELRPRQVMVYTIDRETPDKSLGKYTVEEMTAFVQPLIDEGFDIQIRG